jgi:predicted metal-dependent hydrolase
LAQAEQRIHMGRDLIIGNPPITVDLRRSAGARRLSLRVSRLDGKVTLTMPPRALEREAVAFLTERESWLRGHLADVTPPVSVIAAREVLFRGSSLSIVTGAGRRARIHDGVLELPAGAGARAVKALLEGHARDALAAASDHYAAQIGRSYGRLTLRDTRSRWGSCSSAGALMYSWRLIMAPPEVLNYVAAHEVAHLDQMNHSPAFWAVVAGLMPDYASRREWLRENGERLHQLRFDD